MSDRQIRLERRRYIDQIRRCATCITPVIMLAAPLDDPSVWHVRLATNPTRLPTAQNRTFRITQAFEYRREAGKHLVRPYLHGYRYELAELNGREIFAYHLHPPGTNPITYPHIHVGANDPRLDHGNKHLPTGLVTLEEIVRCLITEFEIPPLRTDWADILATGPGTIPPSSPI